jgi:ribosomal protein S18 acetylase RimI-like enzyme
MIESINAHNLDEIIPLIRKYQEFYKIENINDNKNKKFFLQFGESSDKGCLFAYRLDGKLVAFVTVYFCYASSIISKVGIMNDLYTSKKYRNLGIGKKLIIHCEIYAKQNGAKRLQWVTAPSNKTAQSLYESLGKKTNTWEFFTYSA